MNGKIDLRSDTVTHPTPAMRQVMATAPVGDDVYGDDPTVNELERKAACVTGKEAALFVASGTMGNQLALAVHVNRGDEVILPENCHIVVHEAGGGAYLAGAQFRTLPAARGVPMHPADVERTVRRTPDDLHSPRTALISYENADSDGLVRPLSWMDDIRNIADRYGIPVHMDGARLFNAAAVLNVDAARIAERVDSVMFCLSKGLCAPVGSMLCGTRDFVERARRLRKRIGGGMRQTGILAAAGLIAIDEMAGRLAEDHSHARILATALSGIPGISLEETMSEINMVWFRLQGYPLTETELVEKLAYENVVVNEAEDGLFRFVTHYWVDDRDVSRVATLLRSWSAN